MATTETEECMSSEEARTDLINRFNKREIDFRALLQEFNLRGLTLTAAECKKFYAKELGHKNGEIYLYDEIYSHFVEKYVPVVRHHS